MLFAFIRFGIFLCYTVEYKEETKMLFNTKYVFPNLSQENYSPGHFPQMPCDAPTPP